MVPPRAQLGNCLELFMMKKVIKKKILTGEIESDCDWAGIKSGRRF